MAILSKDVTFGYRVHETGSSASYTEIPHLMEVPDLGQATPDRVEITTLGDSYHKYLNGLQNYPDSIGVKFLYVPTTSLLTFLLNSGSNTVYDFKVTIPFGEPYLNQEETGYIQDTLDITFSGTFTYQIDSLGVNQAITFTLNIIPTTQVRIYPTNPVE